MEIILGKTSGFCNGVNNTVKIANEKVEQEKLYCLGEIVHNERVIKSLEDKGMITVDTLDKVPENSKVIIRAHGEIKETYEEAKRKNIEIIDLTCGKIKAIRMKISKKLDNHFIVIIGKKNHPESKGLLSFSGNNSIIIENEEDIELLKETVKKIDLDKIYVVSQTTYNSEKFDKMISLIKENIEKEIVVDKTICDATSKRQEETRKISSEVDMMLIIGGKKSSNTKELEIVAKEKCNNVVLIQESKDLDDVEINCDIIGIMAGASTPKDVIDEIINKLKGE